MATANIDIVLGNGERAGRTINQLRQQANRLTKEINGLEDGSEEFIKKTGEFQQVSGRLKNMRAQVRGVDTAQKQANKSTGLLTKGLRSLASTLLPLFAISQVIEFGRQLLAIDKKFTKLRQTIKSTSDLLGESLENALVQSEAIGQTFQQENTRIFETARNLVTNFGVSYDEAFKIVEDGLTAAGTKGDEFLEQVHEYSVQFADAGSSAEDFAVQTVKAINDGIFSDKGADVIKEFGLRVREQTTASRTALVDAFGQKFTNDLFNNINKGSITTVEALQLVSAQMNNTTVPANKLQTVVADMFGGPGEDAGLEYLRSLQDIGGEMSDLIDETDEYTRRQRRQLELEKELATATSALTQEFEGQGGIFNELWLQVKILFFETLAGGIRLGKQLVVGLINFFIDLYNESLAFKAAVEGIKFAFETLFGFIRVQFSTVVDLFSGLGELIKAVFTGSFDEIPGIIRARFSDIQDEYNQFGQDVAQNFIEGIKNVASKEKIDLVDLATEGDGTGNMAERLQQQREQIQRHNQQLKEINKERAKQELEAAQNIADLRLAIMQQGQDKEIAAIELDTERRIEALIGSEEQIREQKALLLELEEQRKEEVRQKYRDKQLAEDKKLATEQEGIRGALAEAERSIEAARFETISTTSQAIADIIETEGKNAAAAKKIRKGIALFEAYAALQQRLTAIELAAAKIAATIPPPAGLILAASYRTTQKILAGIETAARVASIRKLQKGGLLQGPSHRQGGIPAVITSTGQPIEMEGGEFVFSRRAVAGIGPELLAGINNKFQDGGLVRNPVNPLVGPVPWGRGGAWDFLPLWGSSVAERAIALEAQGKSLNDDGRFYFRNDVNNTSDPGKNVEENAVVNAIHGLGALIQQWPNQLKVNNNLQETREGIDTINKLEEEASF